ncbi:hypothetical protein J7K24_00595 [bacterium]|nr:hypothetical protein [bacterium]
MINQKIIDYIKKSLKQGAEKEEIREALISEGWSEKEVDEAMDYFFNFDKQRSFVDEENKDSFGINSADVSSLPKGKELLSQAWSLYKQRILTFAGIVALPALLSLLIIGLFVGGLLMVNPSPNLINFIVLIITFISVLLILGIISLWSQLALVYAIKDSSEGIGIIESYRRAAQKLFSFIWMSIISGFIILGGFFLLVIPGILFAIWFSLAVFVLVMEDLKGMDALLKSKEYIKGRFRSVFLRFLYIGCVSFLFLLPVFFFESLDLPLLEDVVEFIIALIVGPLSMIYYFLVYKNLRALKKELPFSSPTLGQKLPYLVIGVVGILIMVGIFFTIL